MTDSLLRQIEGLPTQDDSTYERDERTASAFKEDVLTILRAAGEREQTPAPVTGTYIHRAELLPIIGLTCAYCGEAWPCTTVQAVIGPVAPAQPPAPTPQGESK